MVSPTPLKRPINWRKLRSDEAERVVRQRAEDSFNVTISEHAFDRVELRSITVEDVHWILKEGYIEGDPIFEDGEWKVIVVKRMPGTRHAGVVKLFVQDDEYLFVKTFEWMDWNR